jgi:hypothetical protein
MLARFFRWLADKFDPPSPLRPFRAYPGGAATIAFEIEQSLPASIVAHYWIRHSAVREPGVIHITFEV